MIQRSATNGSPVVQTSFVIQATSVKTEHDDTNMNQGSSINSITKAQNITQTITKPTNIYNQHLKKTVKTNPILKMTVILSAENLQNRTNQMKILNLKETQS